MYTLRIVTATIQVLPKQLLLLALMTVLEGGLGGPITPRPSCNHNFHPRGAEVGRERWIRRYLRTMFGDCLETLKGIEGSNYYTIFSASLVDMPSFTPIRVTGRLGFFPWGKNVNCLRNSQHLRFFSSTKIEILPGKKQGDMGKL